MWCKTHKKILDTLAPAWHSYPYKAQGAPRLKGKMQYTVKKTDGKFNAILTNTSFGWNSIYTFATEAEAVDFLNAEKLASAERLANITSITDYFKK